MIAIDKPDLISTIQSEGIELKQKGRNFWGLCPFHAERTASFKVDRERQQFFCFGCGAHGDCISFIRQYRSLSFKDALKHLGISTGRPSPETLRIIKRQRAKAELVRQFRQWEATYHADICDLYRGLQIAKNLVKSIADAQLLAWAYHAEPLWIHAMDILEGRDDAAKYELYCEVRRNGK